MHADTLFGFLAHRFVVQQENLATDALWYLLDRSEAARGAVIRTLREAGAALPDALSFRTQAGDGDQAIPDLVGEDASGRQVLIAEAKFWAGLTDAQPVAYVQRLAAAGGGTLAVIAPSARLELLWGELVRRCEEIGIAVSGRRALSPEVRSAALQPACHLVILSWRSLLGVIRSALEVSGETQLVSDVIQLQGLCERMDTEAFLPLQAAELTGSIARRILQFNQLVDDAYGLLAARGIADGSGLRSSAGNGWYGRYFRMHGFNCLLHASAWEWSTHAFTPLWLQITGPDWKKASPVAAQALLPLTRNHGVEVFASAEGHDIPLHLPIGVERDAVLRAVVEQLERIADILRGFAKSTATHPGSSEPVVGDGGLTTTSY